MSVEISLVGVGAAFVASVIVGMVWYARPVFGDKWMKLAGLSMKKAQENSSQAMVKMVPLSIVQALCVAITTSLIYGFYPEKTWMASALLAGGFLWIAQAAAIVMHDTFELRKWDLTLVNIGNQLATLLAMGLAIGLFKP